MYNLLDLYQNIITCIIEKRWTVILSDLSALTFYLHCIPFTFKNRENVHSILCLLIYIVTVIAFYFFLWQKDKSPEETSIVLLTERFTTAEIHPSRNSTEIKKSSDTLTSYKMIIVIGCAPLLVILVICALLYRHRYA